MILFALYLSLFFTVHYSLGTLLSHLRAPPAWTADDENSTCTLCDKSFSVSHRRHHCRHCGRLVCKACSPMKVFIPKFGITQKPVRVCSVCHSLLSFPRASEHEFLQQIPSWWVKYFPLFFFFCSLSFDQVCFYYFLLV